MIFNIKNDGLIINNVISPNINYSIISDGSGKPLINYTWYYDTYSLIPVFMLNEVTILDDRIGKNKDDILVVLTLILISISYFNTINENFAFKIYNSSLFKTELNSYYNANELNNGVKEQIKNLLFGFKIGLRQPNPVLEDNYESFINKKYLEFLYRTLSNNKVLLKKYIIVN